MPQVAAPALIAGLAQGSLAYASATVATSAVFANAFFTGFTVTALTTVAARALAPSAGGGSVGGDRTASGTVTSAINPARWVLGRARVDGQLVWLQVQGDALHQLFVLSQGSCDAIERVFVGGEQIPMTRGTGDDANLLQSRAGKYNIGDGKYAVQIRQLFSADGSDMVHVRDIATRTRSALRWTNAHRLLGKSAMLVTLRQRNIGTEPDDALWLSRPGIQVVMRGIKFSSPMADGTAGPVEWTANAAKIICWWLQNRRGIPLSSIDNNFFQASVALCDRQIADPDNVLELPEGQTIRQYQINGLVTSDDPPTNVQESMGASMRGHIIDDNNRYIIRAGGERNRRLVITADDLIEGNEPQIQTGGDVTQRVNSFTLSLPQSKRDDFVSTTITVDDRQAELAAGQRLTRHPRAAAMVNDPIVARNIATGYLAQQRAALTVKLRCLPGKTVGTWGIATLIPDDKVGLFLPEYGLSQTNAEGNQIGRAFYVISRQVNSDLSVDLVLRQWPRDRFATQLAPYRSRPRAVIAPTRATNPSGVQFSVEPNINRNHSSWKLKLSWDDTAFRTRVVASGPQENSWDLAESSLQWDVQTRGVYTFQLWHYSAQSPVSIATTQIVSVSPPRLSRPTNTTFQAQSATARLIIPVTEPNIVGSEVRENVSSIGIAPPTPVTDANWSNARIRQAAAVYPTAVDSRVFIDITVGVSAQYAFGVRLVDSFGQQTDTISFGNIPLLLPDLGNWTREYFPDFTGTHTQTHVWQLDDSGSILVASPGAMSGVQAGSLNGTGGWPFGAPNTQSNWQGEVISFEEQRDRVSVSSEMQLVYPPGVVPESDHVPRVEFRGDAGAWLAYTGTALQFNDVTTLTPRIVFRNAGNTYASQAGVRFFRVNAAVI